MNGPLAEPVLHMPRSSPLVRVLADRDEDLVVDVRAGLSPAQLVERKLIGLLRNTPLPVSHLLTQRRRRG